jgi:putative DNA primase/helicase
VGNAQLLHHLFGAKVRHDAASDRWLLKSDKGLWNEDQEFKIYQFVWQTNRIRLADAMDLKANGAQAKAEKSRQIAWAHKSDSHQSIKSCLAQARALLSIGPDKFDGDPWLLGCPDGVLDLRTGQLLPSIPPDCFISKSTKVSPSPQADCPLWLGFINKITRGDAKLESYLQRLFGYTITGSVREQTLTLMLGAGANGKTTLLNTILSILGDYGLQFDIANLLKSHNDRHSTEMCDLKGRRLVLSTEPDSGRHYREGLLKRLSGGDVITARRVYSDTISFIPTHKLMIVGQSEPLLGSISEADRRRYHFLRFEATFKYETDLDFDPAIHIPRVEGFEDRLESEYPAILRWLLDGCLLWQKDGLNPPESVILSSSEFTTEQDIYQQWLNARCTVGGGCSESTSKLFVSWRKFCAESNEYAGTRRAFTDRLQLKGFKRREIGRDKEPTMLGLMLVNSEDGEDSGELMPEVAKRSIQ